MDSLRGQHVLVTGASGALGSALTAALLASGANVTAAALQRTGLDALRAELHHHDRLQVAEVDTASGKGVEAFFDAIERGTGPLDAVVHTVGGWSGGALVELTDDALESLVAMNFTGAVYVVRAALRRMLPRARGRVVLVGSMSSLTPSPGMAAYGALKAAVAHLTQSAAAEAHAKGVRVNAVLPGTMDTAANRAAMPGADTSRWVSTAAVSRAVLGLLGDAGAEVSGALVTLPDRTKG